MPARAAATSRADPCRLRGAGAFGGLRGARAGEGLRAGDSGEGVRGADSGEGLRGTDPGEGFRWEAAALGRAGEDCGCFRCLADVRDTLDLRSGAAGALSFTRLLARQSHRQLRADPVRFRATRSRSHHTLGAVDPPGCTTRAPPRAGTTQEAGVATVC